MNKFYFVAVTIEVVGISVTSIGIGYEIAYGEPVGYMLITAGSVIVAIGSLLYAKVYSQLRKNKQ